MTPCWSCARQSDLPNPQTLLRPKRVRTQSWGSSPFFPGLYKQNPFMASVKGKWLSGIIGFLGCSTITTYYTYTQICLGGHLTSFDIVINLKFFSTTTTKSHNTLHKSTKTGPRLCKGWRSSAMEWRVLGSSGCTSWTEHSNVGPRTPPLTRLGWVFLKLGVSRFTISFPKKTHGSNCYTFDHSHSFLNHHFTIISEDGGSVQEIPNSQVPKLRKTTGFDLELLNYGDR